MITLFVLLCHLSTCEWQKIGGSDIGSCVNALKVVELWKQEHYPSDDYTIPRARCVQT